MQNQYLKCHQIKQSATMCVCVCVCGSNDMPHSVGQNNQIYFEFDKEKGGGNGEVSHKQRLISHQVLRFTTT